MIIKNSNIVSFYGFIFFTSILYIVYLMELVQFIPRIPGKNLLFTIIFFLILFVFFIKNMIKNSRISLIIFISFVSYLIIYEIFYNSFYTLNNDAQIAETFIILHLTYIYGFLLYFLIGFFHKGFIEHKKILFFLYLVMTSLALSQMDPSTYLLKQDNVNIKLYGIYLFLGDVYAIISIIVFLLLQNSKLHFYIFLISVITLFVLNSRTSLYFFTATIFIILFVTNKKRTLLYFVSILTLLFLVYIFNQQLIDTLMDSRMLKFLFTHQDLSVQGREEYQHIGIQGITNHWFEGDYGGEVIYFGNAGEHIHNYLALFRQYGFIAFTFFLSLLAILVYDIIIWFKNKKEYLVDYNIYIGLSIFLLLEILLARGINFQQVFFVIGISLGTRKKYFKKVNL